MKLYSSSVLCVLQKNLSLEVMIKDIDGFQSNHLLDEVNLIIPLVQTSLFIPIESNGSYGIAQFNFSYQVENNFDLFPTPYSISSDISHPRSDSITSDVSHLSSNSITSDVSHPSSNSSKLRHVAQQLHQKTQLSTKDG